MIPLNHRHVFFATFFPKWSVTYAKLQMCSIEFRQRSAFRVGDLLPSQIAMADSFCWQSVNGQNWNSPIESQFGGTCWDFSSCGNLDAKYNLTRNDPSFSATLPRRRSIGRQIPIWAARAAAGSSGVDLFHDSRRRFAGRMPLPILKPRHRHRPLLAVGQRLAKPRAGGARRIANDFTGASAPTPPPR